MTPNVIDIYRGDVVTDWNALSKSGIWGVIHKSSQGSNYVDASYSDRKQKAKAVGLLWGAYHFADSSDVDDQVRNFLNAAEWSKDSDILLALDYEENRSKTMSIGQAKEFLIKVYEKTGQRPVIYSGNLAKETISGKNEFFGQHRLWLAQYGPKAKLQASWNKYWLWQYAADGIGDEPKNIPGLKNGSTTDVNWFPGSKEELVASWKG